MKKFYQNLSFKDKISLAIEITKDKDFDSIMEIAMIEMILKGEQNGKENEDKSEER